MKLQRSKLLRTAGVYCVALLSHTAMAQIDQTQLDACYAITSNSARLACYDALARPRQATPEAVSQSPAPAVRESASVAPVNRTEPATIAAAADPVRASPPATPVENFGDQARIEADAEGEEALVATVAAIDEVQPRKLQITLANGQVWQQSVGKSFLLRENDTVRITRSPWGTSYRLQKDGKPGYIQVQRLR